MDKFTKAARASYSEILRTRAGSREIDQVLFPQLSESLAALIEMDSYTNIPATMRTVEEGIPAAPVSVKGGVRDTFNPPTHKSEVVFDSSLSDLAIAGTPSTDVDGTTRERIRIAVTELYEGWLAARRKAALGVYINGKFSVFNSRGVSEVYSDFNRKNANEFDWTFNNANTFDKAMAKAYGVLKDNVSADNNLTLLAGSDWLDKFDSDPTVQKKRETRDNLILTEQALRAPELQNVEGLRVYAAYRADGMSTPITILSFNPQLPFVAKFGATPIPYIAKDKAVFFNLGDNGFRFYRGVDTFENNVRRRVIGGMVMDSYVDQRTESSFIRVKSRFFYALRNINHTVVMTAK